MIENFVICINNDEVISNICTCGHSWISKEKAIECPQCKSNIFKNVSNNFNGGNVTSGYQLQLLENGDWGFIVEKYKINAKLDKTNNTLKKTNTIKSILHFDYRKNEFYIENNKGQECNISEYNMPYFFREIDDDYFMDVVATDKFKILLKFAKKHYGSGSSYWCYNKLSKALPRIINKAHFQILVNAGFNYNFLSSLKNFSDKNYYDDDKNSDLNLKETQPHKILNIPKYTITYIKEFDISLKILHYLRILDKKLGAANVKIIFDKFIDECDTSILNKFLNSSSDIFIEMIEKYGYEPKRLIQYLCRDIKLNQGITSPTEGLTLLKDYMQMMTFMNLHPDKYSKSLKKDHDIATMNYKVGKNEVMKENFQKVVNKNTYKNLMFSDKEYTIVLPSEPNDLVAEGKNLSHCVASYVEDVVKEKCKILFIRKKDTTDQSLLTVEIRNDKVIQVKGFGNRYAESDEKEFLRKWCEDKNLLYSA